MSTGMCICMYAGMCMGMHIGICMGMCIGMRIGMCMGMCIDVHKCLRIDACKGVRPQDTCIHMCNCKTPCGPGILEVERKARQPNPFGLLECSSRTFGSLMWLQPSCLRVQGPAALCTGACGAEERNCGSRSKSGT